MSFFGCAAITNATAGVIRIRSVARVASIKTVKTAQVAKFVIFARIAVSRTHQPKAQQLAVIPELQPGQHGRDIARTIAIVEKMNIVIAAVPGATITAIAINVATSKKKNVKDEKKN